MDFTTQQQAVLRQRRLADMLRMQAEQESPYQERPGQMISGRYVAPSWAQNLSNLTGPMANRAYANRQDQLATNQEQVYGTAVDQARQQWQSALPRTIAGHPELQGPQAEGGSPELAAVPNQLPDRASVLRATIEGLNIPGNEKAATLYNAGMGAEIDREDRQKELAAMQQERLAAARQLKLETLQAEEKRLREKLVQDERQNIRDNETRRQHQQTLLAIAAMKNDGSDSKADRKEAAADAKRIAADVLKFSTRMEKVAPVINAAKEIDKMIVDYGGKDVPGLGYVGMLPGALRSAGQELGVLDPNTNANRAKVSKLLNSIVKQEAGLSQTISEQARQIEANLSSGSYSQADFRKAFLNLKQAIANDLVNIKAGHSPEALEIYKERGGNIDPPIQGEPVIPAGQGTRPLSPKQQRLQELRAKQQGQ